MPTNVKFGVLLFDEGWAALGKAIEPYEQADAGRVGRHLYCKDLRFEGTFVVLTIAPDQVQNRIKTEMSIYIPSHFVKFIASGPESSIGFT